MPHGTAEVRSFQFESHAFTPFESHAFTPCSQLAITEHCAGVRQDSPRPHAASRRPPISPSSLDLHCSVFRLLKSEDVSTVRSHYSGRSKSPCAVTTVNNSTHGDVLNDSKDFVFSP